MNPDTLSLYVHFPYCLRKCPYCDFYSKPFSEFDEDGTLSLYDRHLSFYADKVGKKTLDTLYFGGGTPSLMPLSFFDKLLSLILKRFSFADALEMTLEANPKTLDRGGMKAFRAAGVNRLSLGVQALDDGSLKRLGRLHTVSDAFALLDSAAAIFPTYSADFIFGRTGQTLPDLQRDVETILTFSVPHLSFYQLTLHSHYQVPLPSEEEQVDMLHLVRRLLQNAGYSAYEVSNFAFSGHESRHNLAYWRFTPFIGIGPSAHSRIRVDGCWYAGEEDVLTPLSPTDVSVERLMMGLRLSEGVFLSGIKDALNPFKMNDFIRNGFLEAKEDFLRVTDKGLPLLDHLTLQLVS